MRVRALMSFLTPRVLAVTLAAAIVAAPSAMADPATDVVETFLGSCALQMPNLDSIRAASRVMNYEPLSDDMMAMLGPVDPTAESEGWIVPMGDEKLFLGISEGMFHDKPVAICSVAAKIADPELVISRLTEMNSIGSKRYDKVRLGQRTRVWTLIGHGPDDVALLIDGVPSGIDAMSLAAMVAR